MHDCQRFREDWTAGLVEDFGDCEDCRRFCEQAQFILQVTSGEAQPLPELSDAYWEGYDDRLRAKLARENVSRTYRLYWKWSAVPAAAAAAIVVVMTWGGPRILQPIANEGNATPQIEFVDNHIKGLNPSVVEFLGQSELFLRSFTKIEPSYTQDLEDAQIRAKESLGEIETQKLRTADFAPVQIALDEYESVLRDIKNLDSADDVADIQTRIRSSGLIANINAYQPQVMLAIQR
jgi:hypothetical protein